MSAKLALDATAPLQWDVERAVVAEEAAAKAANMLARFSFRFAGNDPAFSLTHYTLGGTL